MPLPHYGTIRTAVLPPKVGVNPLSDACDPRRYHMQNWGF